MKNKKITKIFEEESLDKETWVITTNRKISSFTVPKEEDYIKLYYKTMLAFNWVEWISIDVIISMCNYLSWYNDRENRPLEFVSNRRNRQKMCEDLNKEEITIKKYIKLMIKKWILVKTKDRWVYYCNPYIIAKGSRENIIWLRTHFDFINWTWETDLRIKNVV